MVRVNTTISLHEAAALAGVILIIFAASMQPSEQDVSYNSQVANRRQDFTGQHSTPANHGPDLRASPSPDADTDMSAASALDDSNMTLNTAPGSPQDTAPPDTAPDSTGAETGTGTGLTPGQESGPGPLETAVYCQSADCTFPHAPNHRDVNWHRFKMRTLPGTSYHDRLRPYRRRFPVSACGCRGRESERARDQCEDSDDDEDVVE